MRVQKRVKYYFSLLDLYLGPLQVGPLLGHHLGQQLVLQAVPGHGEVDEGGLSLHLRLVVGVGQLGLGRGEGVCEREETGGRLVKRNEMWN